MTCGAGDSAISNYGVRYQITQITHIIDVPRCNRGQEAACFVVEVAALSNPLLKNLAEWQFSPWKEIWTSPR